MKKNPLLDKDFLKALDDENQREIFVKIASLTFDEDPIEFITGRATGGSINIDGSSSTRRTCSITLTAKELNIHDFYWGLNTKIRVFIGLENNIDKQYDDIIWFNQGIYLITDFSTNQTTNNYTISIQGRDKMSLLNGDIGGIITSLTADFGKVENVDEKGNITITSLPLKEIITEVVHTWAREPYQNIIIEDLDEVGLELMEYRGEEPMYFLVNDKTNEVSNMILSSELSFHKYYYSADGGKTYSSGNNKISLDNEAFIYDTRTELYNVQTTPTHVKDDQGETYTVIKCSYGETIGFRETDLTYAGELIGNVGNSIVQSCLEPIKNMLGNYEYFYDIDGRFHFRRKPTFIDISWNSFIKEDDTEEIYADSKAFTSQVIYSFENANLITSFQNKPQFSNLKNDYSIWGTKTTSGNNTYPVHLRYAIDKKPVYYKNYDGQIYSTKYKSLTTLKQEYEKVQSSMIDSILSQHKKMELPDGLNYPGSLWWNMRDWGELYYMIAGEYPDKGIGQYSQDYDHIDLERYFPGGIHWDASRDLHIFDVQNLDDGNLNGPLKSTVHNPYCSHNYWSYFVIQGETQNFTSYIYNPVFPEVQQKQLEEQAFEYYQEYNNYNCDWREIIYQMAKDYLKYGHKQDFFYNIAQNNSDYYPTGYTGYEMYYTDIISFWREIYNPEFDFDLQSISITKAMFDKNPSEYYWLDQCEDDVAFDYNINYFTKSGYEAYDRAYPTEEQYNLNPNKYYMLRQGKNGQFDRKIDYFILLEDTYNKQKYSAVIVDTIRDIIYTNDTNTVFYVKSENAYYHYIQQKVGSSYTYSLEKIIGITNVSKYLKTKNPEFGWHKDIIENPTNVNFWFDFLDSADGSLSAYNVRNIGNRPKSINDNSVKSIYYRETPTIIFLDSDLKDEEKIKQKKLKPGYTFILFPKYMAPLFTVSTQKKCSKDVLEQWLYDYTKCTQSVTITALPVYYLEPNTRIFIYDKNSGINGEYIVDKISYQLTYNGTMSIQAIKAVDRIY